MINLVELFSIDCNSYPNDIHHIGPKKGFSYEAGPWGFEPQTAGFPSISS